MYFSTELFGVLEQGDAVPPLFRESVEDAFNAIKYSDPFRIKEIEDDLGKLLQDNGYLPIAKSNMTDVFLYLQSEK